MRRLIISLREPKSVTGGSGFVTASTSSSIVGGFSGSAMMSTIAPLAVASAVSCMSSSTKDPAPLPIPSALLRRKSLSCSSFSSSAKRSCFSSPDSLAASKNFSPILRRCARRSLIILFLIMSFSLRVSSLRAASSSSCFFISAAIFTSSSSNSFKRASNCSSSPSSSPIIFRRTTFLLTATRPFDPYIPGDRSLFICARISSVTSLSFGIFSLRISPILELSHSATSLSSGLS